jgi:acetyl-CoA carboxylase biotin carboxyl carrier protein
MPEAPDSTGPTPDARDWPADAAVIRAPMVGTFYRAPEPGARPFVLVGDRVTAETTVCIIEVMKLMNSIPAGANGVVTHVLVEDASPVEANAPLIVVASDGER